MGCGHSEVIVEAFDSIHTAFQEFDVKLGSLSDTKTLGIPRCLDILPDSCITSCVHSNCFKKPKETALKGD
jgi:hypothetical protein